MTVTLTKPSSAAPAYVQGVAQPNNGSGTSATTSSLTTTPGNAFIVVMTCDNSNGSIASVTDNYGNNYQLVYGPFIDTTNNQRMSVFLCKPTPFAGAGHTFTGTFSVSASFRRMIVHEVSGIDSFDVGVNSAPGTNGNTSLSLTPSQANAYIFACLMIDDQPGSNTNIIAQAPLTDRDRTTNGTADAGTSSYVAPDTSTLNLQINTGTNNSTIMCAVSFIKAVTGNTISTTRRTTSSVLKTIVLTKAISSPFIVPDDFNSANNTIHTLGAGGAGHSNDDGSGGAGGAYSAKYNLALTPGASISFGIGSGGTSGGAGGNTWFNGTSLANCSCGAQGGDGGPNSANAVGGQAVNGVGDLKYSGGTSFGNSTSTAARGGGGAAGPNGDGGDALNGNVFVWSCGGGGGANGGADGQPATGASTFDDGTGGDGGNNRFGVGGGSHGTAGSDGHGFDGTNGGGGGGATAGGTDTGGKGSQEDLWTDNSGGTNNGAVVGPGGGGGAGGTAGANGGGFGAGGGAHGSARGTDGLIVIQYYATFDPQTSLTFVKP